MVRNNGRIKSFRKREAKGKAFRKSCEGCMTVENYKAIGKPCLVPYKEMLKCPCRLCLVKVTCRIYCDSHHKARMKMNGIL